MAVEADLPVFLKSKFTFYIFTKFKWFSASLQSVLFVFRSEDLATAILKNKARPNCLFVEDAKNDDDLVVGLAQVWKTLFYHCGVIDLSVA